MKAQQQIKIVVSPETTNRTSSTVSLRQSWALAQSYLHKKPGMNIMIQLQAGTYYIDSTLLLSAADIPAGKGSITFCPEKRAEGAVTISGGQPLTLQWTLWKNGIYKASLDLPFEFSHLYINEEQQIRARYPNFDSSAKHFNGTAADALSPARIKTWQHPEGGYVHALHRAEWGGYHYRITGVHPDGTLQMEGGYQNNRQMGMNENHRFVENIFEELDAEREWYYDKAGKTLYYKPVAGTSLQSATVAVSRLSEIVALKGSAAQPVQNITFTGIRFAHSNATFMDTREPLLRSDWAIYRGGAVLLDGTKDCHITNCEFDHNGGNAVFVSNYNRGQRSRAVIFTMQAVVVFVLWGIRTLYGSPYLNTINRRYLPAWIQQPVQKALTILPTVWLTTTSFTVPGV